MNRRFFLLAAPAIVAAPSLMRVSVAALPGDAFSRFAAAFIRPQVVAMNRQIIIREAMMHLEDNILLAKLVNRDFAHG